MGQKDFGNLAALAARQAGCASTAQALELGVSRRRLTRACTRGLMEPMHPDVWRFAGTDTADRARIWAAVLQAGPLAVASHESALRLHGVRNVPFAVVVTVPPDGEHRIRAVRVHRFCDLYAEHHDQVGGVPTTTLPRAVVDASSAFSLQTMRHLVDQVTITQRLTSVGAISRSLRQVNKRGRFGIGSVGLVLDERSDGKPVVRSLLERHMDALLAACPLPTPIREAPLPSNEPWTGYVDRAWPEAQLILEIDGRTWHSRESDMVRDRAHDRAAAARGWMTVRVLDAEVTECPDAVIGDLTSIHADRMVRAARAA